MKTYQYNVTKASESRSPIVTLRVDLKFDDKGPNGYSAETQPGDVLNYLRSFGLKQEFYSSYVNKNFPNYGVEVFASPYPIHEKSNDRESKVIAYAVDFRLNPGL
jgi:hypothetical protein